MVRFLGKPPRRKYVRMISNSVHKHVIPKPEEVVKKEDAIVEQEEKTNKKTKKEKNMADERLEKVEQLMGTKAPKRKVKVEKKDKGLIERTENSTVLLTEDNKMLLND